MDQLVVCNERQLRKILSEEFETKLERRIPEIIRRASRKSILTTSDVKELTGISSRMQKYHRDKGHLPYSQNGRRILYRTEDIEAFIDHHSVNPNRRKR